MHRSIDDQLCVRKGINFNECTQNNDECSAGENEYFDQGLTVATIDVW